MSAVDLKPLKAACEWLQAGHNVALATVIKTWGSAPRPVGSHLVIRDDGLFEGSVSGGCVEGEVVVEAQEAMDRQSPRRLEYGVSNSQAWDVGLACGGNIQIFVLPLSKDRHPALFQDLLGRHDRREKSLALIDLESGQYSLLGREQTPAHTLAAALQEAERSDKSRIATGEDGEVFVQVVTPPVRLLLIGAVHISQALLSIVAALDWDVTIIDPRGAFASRERFPDARLVEDWPDEFLDSEPPDDRTAVVTLTHDPKLDDAALSRALRSPAFYVGSLGSRKTHAARRERLEQAGFTSAEVERIHAPVGLSIGAASPAEIAVSILAEIIQILRSE